MSGRVEIKPCFKCGMDSGERRSTVTEPPKFCVICTGCGARTRMFRQLAHATKEWNDLYEAAQKK